MDNPRVIGHVISVNGFRVKVELLAEAKSPSRATLDGVQTAVAINSYLVFSIGAGLALIGVITDLEARESYDPSGGEVLSLDLIKARRVATVQLLGTIEQEINGWTFNAGITILPTLDTPAEIGSPQILSAAFENPPKKNKPEECIDDDGDFDFGLGLGCPTGQKSNKVKASYNDLFSRPLAIVGNTGSGKSYSVASILQKAIKELGDDTINAPHIFILDINGEYAKAFLNNEQIPRQPDHIYLNGQEFGIPLWFFNAQEICAWLSASEQTQEPVLKDWWAVVKSQNNPKHKAQKDNSLQLALSRIGGISACLDNEKAPFKKTICLNLHIANDFLGEQKIDGMEELKKELEPHSGQLKASKNLFMIFFRIPINVNM